MITHELNANRWSAEVNRDLLAQLSLVYLAPEDFFIRDFLACLLRLHFSILDYLTCWVRGDLLALGFPDYLLHADFSILDFLTGWAHGDWFTFGFPTY